MIGAIALLGVIGVLEALGTLFASEQQAAQAGRERPELRIGALRLLVVRRARGRGLLGGRGGAASGGSRRPAALAAVVVADLWSVDRRFFDYKPPASELFADDADHHAG